MKCEYCDRETSELNMKHTYFVSGKGMCNKCYDRWWENRHRDKKCCDDCGRNFSQIGVTNPYHAAGKQFCRECFNTWLSSRRYLWKKETKRVFSDVDPYGEEDWDE